MAPKAQIATSSPSSSGRTSVDADTTGTAGTASMSTHSMAADTSPRMAERPRPASLPSKPPTESVDTLATETLRCVRSSGLRSCSSDPSTSRRRAAALLVPGPPEVTISSMRQPKA